MSTQGIGPYRVERKDSHMATLWDISGPTSTDRWYGSEGEAQREADLLNAAYLAGKQEHTDTAWISVEEKMPLDGQFCWVCYYPWNNKSNALAVQEASWKNGLWITTQPEGTSYPPTHWMLHPGPVPPAPPQTPVEP